MVAFASASSYAATSVGSRWRPSSRSCATT
jgi:hypothetical protein